MAKLQIQLGGMPPGKFEILHALKCVLEAPGALFCAYTQYSDMCFPRKCVPPNIFP